LSVTGCGCGGQSYIDVFDKYVNHRAYQPSWSYTGAGSTDGKLIGECSLFNLMPQSRRAEVGYTLAHEAWGKGYINEALVALLEFGFTQLGLNRVEADIDPRNVASARTLERLGFQREGLLRQRWIVGDEVSDTAIYGLLAHEWRAKRG